MMLHRSGRRVDCMDDYHQGYLDDPWTPRIFNLYLMANVASTDFSPSRLICREESQCENASFKPRLTDMDWSPHRANRRVIIGRERHKNFWWTRQPTAQFDRINKRLRHEQMRVIKIQSLNVPLVQILAAITIGIVILVGTVSARDL